MNTILDFQIIIAVFSTSLLSGVFGMAGGMVLMGIFGLILPINLGMIFHGIAQCSANGFRAYLNRQEIDFSVLKPYLIGTLLALGLLRIINFQPNITIVYLGLGIFPFISFLPKIGNNIDITKKNMPLFCGFIVTAAQIFAGVSGGILDLFYYKSKFNRFAIIANKAFTQTFAHFLKIIYFGSFVNTFQSINTSNLLTLIPIIILAALLGTIFGKKILNYVSEQHFKLASKWLLISISLYMLAKGMLLSLT